jgi:hypothetical protein
VAKNFSGMPDPGEGENGQPLERQAGRQRFQGGRAGSAPGRCDAPSRSAKRSCAASGPIDSTNRRGEAGTPPVREAVRREGRAIAEAAMGIHHDDRKIVGERGVLKPVVEQDDIGPRPGRRARARKPVLGHPGLREGGEKQRLVAGVGRAVTKFFYQNGPLPATRHARV